MDDSASRWDIAKIDIKPGNILVLRYHRPSWPGVASERVYLHGEELEKVLKSGKEAFRETLDALGYTHKQIPIICMTEEWDIAVLNPLELMDACATAAKAGEE